MVCIWKNTSHKTSAEQSIFIFLFACTHSVIVRESAQQKKTLEAQCLFCLQYKQIIQAIISSRGQKKIQTSSFWISYLAARWDVLLRIGSQTDVLLGGIISPVVCINKRNPGSYIWLDSLRQCQPALIKRGKRKSRLTRDDDDNDADVGLCYFLGDPLIIFSDMQHNFYLLI